MTFEDKYNALIQEYEAKLSIPNWFVSGFKTLLDKNITIEDWNKVYTYLQRMASDNNVLRKILDLLKFEFDEKFTIEDNLNSYATTRALSANQGRILNEKILNEGSHNLGVFLTDPASTTHNILNKDTYVKHAGFYNFKYEGVQYLLFVDVYTNQTVQTIYANENDGFTRIVRTYTDSTWSVDVQQVPTLKKIQNLLDAKVSTKKELPTDIGVGNYVFLIKEEK